MSSRTGSGGRKPAATSTHNGKREKPHGESYDIGIHEALELVERIEKRRADILRSRSAPAGKNNGDIPSKGKELKRGIEATELGPGADEITVIVPKLNVKVLTVIVPGTGGPKEAPEAKLMINL